LKVTFREKFRQALYVRNLTTSVLEQLSSEIILVFLLLQIVKLTDMGFLSMNG